MSVKLMIAIALGALTLIFAALTVVFIVLWRKEKAKNKKLKNQLDRKLSADDLSTVTDAGQKHKEGASAEKKGELALQLKKYADRFGGLYESLYRVIKVPDNFSSDIFVEFYERALLISDNSFQRAFLRAFPSVNPDDVEKSKKDSDRLLCLIDSAGITRDKSDVIKDVTPDVSAGYLDEKGGRPSKGKHYQVISPAWRCDGKTVEEGLLITVTSP